jgi:alkyldihydroxyacetonephosphate synthase
MHEKHSAVPPPIGFSVGAGELRERLGGKRVALDDRFLERLSSACATLDFAPDSLASSSRDWWPISLRWALSGAVPARPGVVARPADTAEVAAVLRCCNEAGVPVTAAGGRSGVCGGSVPVFGGVSLDCCGLDGLEEVHPATSLVDVRAGTFVDDLENELRAVHGITLGHWPQSVELATIGGSIACRGAGQYSTRYGKIEDMVAGLEVVLADGTIVRTGAMAGHGAGPRSAMGPDLTSLFVGSEGTLGVITSARLRCHPAATEERRAAWAFPSFAEGLEALRRTLRRGATPAVVRLYDETESKRSFDGLDTNVLVALDEGDGLIVEAAMAVLSEECWTAEPLDVGIVEHWFASRNDVSDLESVIRAGIVADTIEVAAPWDALLNIYHQALAALQETDGMLVASAHQSHAYLEGACLYFTFAGWGPDPADDAWAESFYRSCWQDVLGATSANGGSISHHHGIGLMRGPFLPDVLGAGFEVLKNIKKMLDPRGILNPGKLGLPSPFGAVPWSQGAALWPPS